MSRQNPDEKDVDFRQAVGQITPIKQDTIIPNKPEPKRRPTGTTEPAGRANTAQEGTAPKRQQPIRKCISDTPA